MTALDLKYRPAKFSDVVGNRAVVQLLLARSKKGTLAGRSMMFGGPKGCGKTSLARIAARAIACSELVDGEPCGECTACVSVLTDASTSTDEFDAATQGTVDRIRAILDDLEYGTFDGKPRVVILDEAHRLSKPSQDALLKAIEDRRFVVVLCTTEPHKIGEAIRSRVEEYPVTPPTLEEMTARMKAICTAEQLNHEPEALTTIASALGNCPRTCISALGTLSTLGSISQEAARSYFRYGSMESLVEVLALIDSDSKRALALLDDVMAVEGPNWTRDVMVHAIASSLREAVGARATFPVKTRFFEVRGRDWANLARDLGKIDKPTASDVESCLLASCAQVPIVGAPAPRVISSADAPAQVQTSTVAFDPGSTFDPVDSAPPVVVPTDSIPVADPLAGIAARLAAILPTSSSPKPASPPAEPPPAPKPVPAPAKPNGEKPALLGGGNLFVTPAKVTTPTPIVAKPKTRQIEIDGVQFSSDESLTSLDSKIEHGSGVPVIEPPPPSAEVEYDRSRAPMPEKEFARGFIQRVKQGN